jgi:hypothetical protein
MRDYYLFVANIGEYQYGIIFWYLLTNMLTAKVYRQVQMYKLKILVVSLNIVIIEVKLNICLDGEESHPKFCKHGPSSIMVSIALSF